MVAMARVVQVPDIRRVDLPEARQAIPHVHAYLRECILDGTLPPGTKLSQVSLAAQLGISRTPLREVLRMLQEEGLVEIEPNQRTRVAGLDPAELDDIYASRILLETLALSMTIGHFGAKARGQERRLRRVVRGPYRIPPSVHRGGGRDHAAPAAGLRRPDHPLYPHLPAIRAQRLAGGGRRGARGDPGGADRGRRAGRAHRDGVPPVPHGAAGAE